RWGRMPVRATTSHRASAARITARLGIALRTRRAAPAAFTVAVMPGSRRSSRRPGSTSVETFLLIALAPFSPSLSLSIASRRRARHRPADHHCGRRANTARTQVQGCGLPSPSQQPKYAFFSDDAPFYVWTVAVSDHDTEDDQEGGASRHRSENHGELAGLARRRAEPGDDQHLRGR